MKGVINSITKPIIFVGDIHGLWGNLFDRIEARDIRDCYLIGVGDLGVGFRYSPEGEVAGFEKINEFFKSRNISFLGIRGNHDDPAYFKGEKRPRFSHFELLEDYTSLTLNGSKFLFVGGAISIDRLFRKPFVSYWPDEDFVLDKSKVVPCDVLVTHTAPTWNGPFDKEGIAFYCEKDPQLWDDCFKERKDMDRLLELAKPKHHYAGHFHTYCSVEHNGCLSRILDELQFHEHREL